MEHGAFPRFQSLILTTKEGINTIPYESFPYVFVDPAFLQCSCDIRSVITQINQHERSNSEIQWQPKHVIKESCNKISIILWERDMPPYYINERYKIQLNCLDVASSLSVALRSDTHIHLLRPLHEYFSQKLDGWMETSSITWNMILHTVFSLLFLQSLCLFMLVPLTFSMRSLSLYIRRWSG